ncbi:hypothetical protein ABK040_014920 [Willaertia magna]
MGNKPSSRKKSKSPLGIVSRSDNDDTALLPALQSLASKDKRHQKLLSDTKKRIENYSKDAELLSKTKLRREEFKMLKRLFTSFCKECLKPKNKKPKEKKKKKNNHDNNNITTNNANNNNANNNGANNFDIPEDELFLTKEECFKLFFPKINIKNLEEWYSKDEKLVMECLFHALSDFNPKQILTFTRFVLTLSIMCEKTSPTIEQKAEWTFSFFDINQQNYLTKENVLKIMKGLKSMYILRIPDNILKNDLITVGDMTSTINNQIFNNQNDKIEKLVEMFFERAKNQFKELSSQLGEPTLQLYHFTELCKDFPFLADGLGIVEAFFNPIIEPVKEFLKRENPYEIFDYLTMKMIYPFKESINENEIVMIDYQNNLHNYGDDYKKMFIEIRGGILRGYIDEEKTNQTLHVDLRKIEKIETESEFVMLTETNKIVVDDKPVIESNDSPIVPLEMNDSINNEGEGTTKSIVNSSSDSNIRRRRSSHKRSESLPAKPMSAIALSPSFSIVFESEEEEGKYYKIIFIANNPNQKMLWMFTILMYLIQGTDNRFNSFAPERKARVKYYVDGKDAFRDIYVALSIAEKEIYITDWCINPLIYLLRGNGKAVSDSRLDIILKNKASQGVQIYILIWKETEVAKLNLETKKSKHYLRSLYPRNIHVKTHPKKYPAEWSHHQKIVVVDQSIAFLGGLDLCYGRWDDYHHSVTDNNHCFLKYPNFDYVNPNIGTSVKFTTQENFKMENFRDALDREYQPRQPWHDVHCLVADYLALDVSRNFIDRWNHHVEGKHLEVGKLDTKLFDTFTRIISKQKNKSELKATQKLQKLKLKLQLPNIRTNDDYEDKLAKIEQDYKLKIEEKYNKQTTATTPAGVTSPGTFFPHHGSVGSNAEVIELEELNDNERITSSYAPVEIKIEKEAPYSPSPKHHTSKPININNKVITDIKDIKMKGTNESNTSNNPFAKLRDPTKKFTCPDAGIVCSAQIVRSISKWSGSNNDEQSIYAAYLHFIDSAKHYIYIENQYFIGSTSDAPKNVVPEYIARKVVEKMKANETFRVFIVLPSHPEGNMATVTVQQIMKYTYKTIKHGPNSIYSYIKRHVQGATDTDIEQYISFYTLRNYGFLNNKENYDTGDASIIKLGDDSSSSSDDSDSDEDEHFKIKSTITGKKAVTEHVYVHSKLMIIDDNVTIIGSANINDRSLLGTRDSEIAVVIQDRPSNSVNSKMNGRAYKAGKFSQGLRIRLWREHLGLLPSQNEEEKEQNEELEKEENTTASEMNEEEQGDIPTTRRRRWKWQISSESTRMKKQIIDPISDNTYKDIWMRVARKNTDIYEYVFPDIISDRFKTLDEFLRVNAKNSIEALQAEKERLSALAKERLLGSSTMNERVGLEENLVNSTDGTIATNQVQIAVNDSITIEPNLVATNAIEGGSISNHNSVINNNNTRSTLSSNISKMSHSPSLIFRKNERQKRKLLKQIQGYLCFLPLDFAKDDNWKKPLYLDALLDDSIFV